MYIIIRNAILDDYNFIESIMKQTQQLHVEWRPDIYRPLEVVLSLGEFTEAVSQKLIYVAELKGTIVGILSITYNHVCGKYQVERNVIFINAMAVDKRFQGKGVGHKFLEYLEKLKIENNMDGIELQVNAKNIQAIEMYEKCGFTYKSINMELLH